jgi:hypothetical protein
LKNISRYKYLQTKKSTKVEFNRELYQKQFDAMHDKLLLFIASPDEVEEIYKRIAAVSL